MNLRTIILSTSFVWLILSSAFAQQPKKERIIMLYGRAVDSFTRADLDAFVTIMGTDSIVVDTASTSKNQLRTEKYYTLEVPHRASNYIIKVESKGYHTTYFNYDVKYIARKRFFEVPPISLKRKFAEEDSTTWDNELEGVTVKGTRIKVVHKGDTIIFNAAAFNLPEGSMLDGLIKQMPGVELKDNGDIYVNGRKIDFLTLNGEDFFKGNNKLMLENLPYYTVQDIKVYNKETDKTRLTGIETEMKDYVMDVQLKREYNRNYLGNIEVGYGTRKRDLGRMFGLYFDDFTRFSVFGNINNINESRRPGTEGDWSPSNQPEGIKNTRLFGFNFMTSNREKTVKEQIESWIEWGETATEETSSIEHFLSDKNSNYSLNHKKTNFDKLDLNIENTFELKKPFSLYSETKFRYYKWDNNSDNQTAIFNERPNIEKSTTQILDSVFKIKKHNETSTIVSTNRQQSKAKYDWLLAQESMWISKDLPWGDIINIELTGRYYRDRNKNYSYFQTKYPQIGTEDVRNSFADVPNKQYYLQAQLTYTFVLPNDFIITPYIIYRQHYQSRTNDWYRLDKLNNNWDDISVHQIGSLPSTRDSLLLALDLQTSYRFNNFKRTYTEGLRIARSHTSAKGTYSYMHIALPIDQFDEKNTYHGDNNKVYHLHRHHSLFQPDAMLYLAKDNWQKSLQLNYDFTTEFPQLHLMVPLVDNRQATAIRIRNTQMRPNITHTYSMLINNNKNAINQNISLSLQGNIIHGNFGTRTFYASQTGTYIYKDDNINGNWSLSLNAAYGRDIDKKKHWHLEANAFSSLLHSVDFQIQRIDSSPIIGSETDYNSIIENLPSNYSKVDNINYGGKIKCTYSKGNLTASASSQIVWYRASSSTADFIKTHARDVNYGMTLQYKFPLDLQFATDMKLFTRRGYQTKEMNTDNLIWNASLSKSFLKNKLLCTIEAFDILHQLSSTTYSVNAQGKTEMWKLTIPNYVMIKIAYKFSKK